MHYPSPLKPNKYAQKTLCTKTPLSRGVTGKTFHDTKKKKKKETNKQTQALYSFYFVNQVDVRLTSQDTLNGDYQFSLRKLPYHA